jgi:phosphate acyltransferase
MRLVATVLVTLALLAAPAFAKVVKVTEGGGFYGTVLAEMPDGRLLAGGALNFVGNVEGRDIVTGVADVLVTDGFTGNVILKTAEGVAREILGMLRIALTDDFLSRLAAGVLRPRLVGVKDRVDPENYGGSYLLGVKGSVVIGHGNSGPRGVENALIGISRTGAGLPAVLKEALAAARAAATTGDAT